MLPLSQTSSRCIHSVCRRILATNSRKLVIKSSTLSTISSLSSNVCCIGQLAGSRSQRRHDHGLRRLATSSSTSKPTSRTDATSKTTTIAEDDGKPSQAASKTSTAAATEVESPHPDSHEEKKKRVEKMATSYIRAGYVMIAMTIGGMVYLVVKYGPPAKDADGNTIDDEFSQVFAPIAYLKRARQKAMEWQAYAVQPSRQKLLPDPLKEPFHQPKYTLCVELNHVLVNPEWTYGTGWRFKKRAALDYFLKSVGYPNFELVLYTYESGDMANAVVDSVDDPNMPRIMYRLYKDTNEFSKGHFRKVGGACFCAISHLSGLVDKRLDLMNRDLSKVILVDWDPEAVAKHPENTLLVPKWTGRGEDTSLLDLAELLKLIQTTDADDVRPILQYYSQFGDPAQEFRKRNIALAQSEAASSKQKQAKEGSTWRGYAGSLFGYGRHM